MGCCGLDACGSGQGSGADFCEHSNKPPVPLKSGQFID